MCMCITGPRAPGTDQLYRSMADASFVLESIIRGHCVYKNIWTPTIGEALGVM